MTQLEARLSSDLTRYLQAGGEHAPNWDRPSPDRTARDTARRARMLALPERLEITGGTGNLMVNICRSQALQSATDRAARARGGPGGVSRMSLEQRERRWARNGPTARQFRQAIRMALRNGELGPQDCTQLREYYAARGWTLPRRMR